jgi:hypothetical protein
MGFTSVGEGLNHPHRFETNQSITDRETVMCKTPIQGERNKHTKTVSTNITNTENVYNENKKQKARQTPTHKQHAGL